MCLPLSQGSVCIWVRGGGLVSASGSGGGCVAGGVLQTPLWAHTPRTHPHPVHPQGTPRSHIPLDTPPPPPPGHTPQACLCVWGVPWIHIPLDTLRTHTPPSGYPDSHLSWTQPPLGPPITMAVVNTNNIRSTFVMV